MKSEIAHGEIPGAIVIQADKIENSELVDKSKKVNYLLQQRTK